MSEDTGLWRVALAQGGDDLGLGAHFKVPFPMLGPIDRAWRGRA